MGNSNIVILQISKNVLNNIKGMESQLKEYAKFFEVFGEKVLALFHEKTFSDKVDLYSYLNREIEIDFEINMLSTFAKSRLISNFDVEHPELSLVIMSCGKESKLIKIKERK